MRTTWLGLAGAVAALLGGGYPAGVEGRAPAPQDPPTGTAAISGVVTDAATGRTIAGASVSLYGIIPDGPTNAPLLRLPSVLTDSRGRFVFVNLSSKPRYTLAASRAGYAVGSFRDPDEVSYGWLIRAGERLPIQLAEGEWKRDANIRMWRSGSIGGRVVDERGEPVVGAAVQIFSRRMLAGHERLLSGAVVSTDDRGIYRVAFVEPGRYLVAVLSVQATVPASTPDGDRHLPIGGMHGRGRPAPQVSRAEAQGASLDVDGRHRLVLTNFVTPPPAAAARPRAYAPVYHPAGRSPAEAQAVEIGPGASRGDIDFQLAPTDTARVSGRVAGDVENAAGMLLRLMPRGAEGLGFGGEVATTLVEADGGFTFLNVPSGDYTLLGSSAVAQMSGGGGSSIDSLPRGVGYGRVRGLSWVYPDSGFSAMWWRGDAGATVWARAPVSVGGADVAALEIPLRSTATVRGHVVFDDPDPAASSRPLSIQLEPANGDPALGVPNTFTEAGDETPAFEIAGLQGGRYLVKVQRFGGWRVKSVTIGGEDLTETGFDGSLGRDYDEVVVTVTRTGAELTGTVTGRNGSPSPAAVILFPTERERRIDYGLSPDRVRSITADAAGLFSFTMIPDGEYLVIAVPRSQADARRDPAFLASAEAHATRVTLRTGTPKTQDLRIAEVVVR